MVTLQRKSRLGGTESLVECHRLIANQRHIPRIAKEGDIVKWFIINS